LSVSHFGSCDGKKKESWWQNQGKNHQNDRPKSPEEYQKGSSVSERLPL
jgi:hypothetical protein